MLHLHTQSVLTIRRTVMLKIFCLAATSTIAVIALLPLVPKTALAQGCYMLTSDGWRIDLNSLCTGSPVPVYTTTKVNTSNQRNEWGLSLDLPLYCRSKYGPDTSATLRENNVLGWKCSDGKQFKTISFEEACSMQYGPFARPSMGKFDEVGSWNCRLTKSLRH